MMGTAKTALHCGFLAMIVFVSGNTALRCHSSSSIVQNGSRVAIPTEVSIGDKIITCTKGQNACVEAQVKLSIAQTFLLVTHRGCTDKELDGAGSNSSGDPHFTVKSNVRYCFRDLCNQEMSVDVPEIPREDTATEESGSNHCYSGLMLDPKESLGAVTCRKGYSQCYHGNSTIRTGPLAMSVLIKTCQRPPCIAPKSQSFGPIEIHQWGSCCVGSHCNETETAPKTQNTTGDHSKVIVSSATSLVRLDAEKSKEGTSPAPATTASLPGRPFKRNTNSRNTSYEILTDYNYTNYYYSDEGPNWKEPDIKGEAFRFHSCPFSLLLVALGIAVFGAWW